MFENKTPVEKLEYIRFVMLGDQINNPAFNSLKDKFDSLLNDMPANRYVRRVALFCVGFGISLGLTIGWFVFR